MHIYNHIHFCLLGSFDFICEPTNRGVVYSYAPIGPLYVSIYMYNQSPSVSPHSPTGTCILSTSGER